MPNLGFLSDFIDGLISIDKLTGGDINEVYKVHTTSGKYVVKLNQKDNFPNMFQAELEGLKKLSEKGNIRCPDHLRVFEKENQQALLMEYISPGKASNQSWKEFGKSLAELHLNSNQKFGLERDNYIGSLIQKNNYCVDWQEFLISQRLNPMIEMAVNSGEINYIESKKFDGFLKRIEEIYPLEKPALLHGDLWSGNFLIDNKCAPVLIDPAVYYGHREMEIGMMHLFGGFDNLLFDTYNEYHALENKWRDRVEINQLYPLMVHVNLFGRSYWEKVERILRPF